MRRCAINGALLVIVLVAACVLAQQAAEPVHYSKLLPFLPDKVAGFVADKPKGSTTSAMGLKLTEVSRVYHRGSARASDTVTVKITDGAGNPFFAAAYADAKQFSNESPEGYQKGFTLDGYPAIEQYTHATKEGSLSVLIADHDLVEISVKGLDSATLQEWWKKIDAKKLAALRE
jgi:hypothetical protein